MRLPPFFAGYVQLLETASATSLFSRPSRRLWPIFVSGFLVLSYLLYLASNRAVPHIASNANVPIIFTPSSQTSSYDFTTTPLLLVSAFFPLPTSKHTHEEYAAWMRLFLSQIATPMVIFTSKSFAPTIEQLRGSLPVIIDTQFETPFDVPPLKGLEPAYAKQHDELDPEKSRHNPALYATWNAKAWLLQYAAEHYVKTTETEWFFWSDAGALRETHTFVEWPDVDRVKNVFATASKESGTLLADMFFIPIWDAPTSTKKTREWQEADGPLDLYKMSEGSMFGGKLPAIRWWASTFYAMHDKYLAENKFVGKDQNIFNAILFLNPARVFTVWPRDPLHRRDSAPTDIKSQHCTWDPWYYYFYWLASDSERLALHDHMAVEYQQLSLFERTLAWFGLHFWKAGRGECGIMKGWSFRDILWENVART